MGVGVDTRRNVSQGVDTRRRTQGEINCCIIVQKSFIPYEVSCGVYQNLVSNERGISISTVHTE